MDDETLTQLREELCHEEGCIEHGAGTIGCPVPDTEEEIDQHSEYTYQSGTVSDIDPVEVPRESTCPVCGSEPTDESIQKHLLSDMGYRHDDVYLKCSNEDCDNDTWTLGVPIGEYEGGNDLWCKSCDSSYYRVHRVQYDKTEENFDIHLKCPNEECYHFKTVEREPDERGVSLIGYPDITGQITEARAYGYQDGDTPGE